MICVFCAAGKPVEHDFGADDDAAPELIIDADLAAAHELNVGRRRKGAAQRVGKIGAAQPAPSRANVAADIETGPIIDRSCVDRRRNWCRCWKIGCECRGRSGDTQGERKHYRSAAGDCDVSPPMCVATGILRDVFPVSAACGVSPSAASSSVFFAS